MATGLFQSTPILPQLAVMAFAPEALVWSGVVISNHSLPIRRKGDLSNSSGDIVPSKENASEPIISFKENAKITDILTTKSAANLSMSKKQLINIETTVPGYKHGFVLQTGTGFSRKRDAYLFSDKYVSEKLFDNDLNAVGSAVVNKSAKSIQIALGELVSSVIKNVNEEYPNLKISLLVEQEALHLP